MARLGRLARLWKTSSSGWRVSAIWRGRVASVSSGRRMGFAPRDAGVLPLLLSRNSTVGSALRTDQPPPDSASQKVVIGSGLVTAEPHAAGDWPIVPCRDAASARCPSSQWGLLTPTCGLSSRDTVVAAASVLTADDCPRPLP